jgi:hypothetical protein
MLFVVGDSRNNGHSTGNFGIFPVNFRPARKHDKFLVRDPNKSTYLRGMRPTAPSCRDALLNTELSH